MNTIYLWIGSVILLSVLLMGCIQEQKSSDTSVTVNGVSEDDLPTIEDPRLEFEEQEEGEVFTPSFS
ncbi:hypothetical protein JXB01_03465 [Candidatus Micrarchaeota archaeon]|nr:hypothetical protein [Candidatus Micrarchaeota archaeon]